MPLFRYTATETVTGKKVNDVVNMATEDMVMDYLYVKGLSPVDIKEIHKNVFQKAILIFQGIKEDILLLFLRQFAVMIKAGIPIYRALDIIIQQTEEKKLRTVCTDIRNDIGEGANLSSAMKNHPAVFSEFLVSMVSVGETRGELEYSLNQVVEFLEKAREIKNKIVAAMIYPAVLIVAGLGIMIAMVTFVLPKFMDIFSSYDVSLPMPTQILMGVSDFLTGNYIYLTAGVFAVFAGIFVLGRIPWGKYLLDWIRLHMLIIGPITQNVAISRFVRTLGVLHRGGVPLIRALELSADAAANMVIVKEISKVIESVKDGKGIATPLSESKTFPSLLVQMMGIGEESGALDIMALEVADFYDQETEYKIKRQMALMEPIALVVIAVIVAFIAASFLLPMFKIATSMRR
ncbi:type II secretion system F family protein [Candidatus Margulisiibacteriota bacterium]